MNVTNKNVPLVSKELVVPFILITTLFALWGFANAVTDPMVTAFKKVLELNNFQASLVQMAFYGGYFTMALPASLYIRKYSYKSGVLVGLALYAVGALLFYPAAVMQEFSFFLAGLYILTFGLAFLETTANPYIMAMGDSSNATRRLNLAQAFNPFGLLTGLFVAQHFVLRRLQSDDIDFSALSNTAKVAIRQADLLVIRNPYVVLGLVVLACMFVIWMVKMPAFSDAGERIDTLGLIRRLIVKKRYSMGVVSQACCVGAQIMAWTYIYHYAESLGIPAESAGNYQFAAFMLFFTGRFICTLLLKYLDSGKLLMWLSLLAVILIIGVIASNGVIGLYFLVGVSFCMSLMFPTIYGISLEGLRSDEVKIGAAGLVMAIVGGALMPTIQGAILDLGGDGYTDIKILGVREVNFSFVLPLACFLVIAWFGYNNSKSLGAC